MRSDLMLVFALCLSLVTTARGFDGSLPAAAKSLVDAFDADVEAIQKKAEADIKKRRDELVAKLSELQQTLAKSGKADEAKLVAAKIGLITLGATATIPDPGTFATYAANIGKVYAVETTGAAFGFIWGTDVYTGDSTLAVAAVHAGALKVGEKGVVKVTIVPSPPMHTGSTRNGITSQNWILGFPCSYKVEKP